MQFLDYIPFLLIPILFKIKRSSRILPNTLSFWFIVVAILILSLFTTILHNGAMFASISHFGALFRYAPLSLLIWIMKPSTKEIKLFYNNFVIISLILIFIGYLEIFLGNTVRNLFLPLTQVYSSAKIESLEDINGIFPNTVDYSYFLLVSYIIISNRNPRVFQFGWFLLYAIPIFFSGSKAALIIFMICTFYKTKKLKKIKAIFISGVTIIGGILIFQYWELLYWIVFVDSLSSRLGYIIFTFPSFIQELSLDTLIGVSPDKQIVFNKINSYPNAPMMTWYLHNMGSFEDEFYVALPIYYGLLGFGLLATIFIGMYRAFIRSHWIDDCFNYSLIIKSLFTTLLIAPLFNQIIILKPFAIFFWCWIGIFLTRTTKKHVEKYKSI